jgi:hypothetical protein
VCARVRQAPNLGEVDRTGGAPASELVGIIVDLCWAARSAIEALAAEELLDTKARRMVTQQARQLLIASLSVTARTAGQGRSKTHDRSP